MPSIKKRPDGVYRARYRDGSGKEHAAHFDNRTDAANWLSVQVADVLRGTWVDPKGGKITFGEYAERWFAAQLHHSPNTRQITRSRLDVHLLPFFKDSRLAAVSQTDVRGWVAGRSTVLAPSSVDVVYRLLGQVFKAAVNDGLLARSPCRDVRLPRLERTVRVPTSGEAWAVADKLPAYLAVAVALGAGAGLRLGETLGLTIDRVDFLRRQITVNRQLQTFRGSKPELVAPKSKASSRTIPVADELVTMLAEHLARYPSDGLIVRGRNGQPVRDSSFHQTWRQACKDAKVELRYHDLRHLYASSLIAGGCSIKVVQERLGHASAAMTLGVYGHLLPGDTERTRTATAGLFRVREKSAAPRTGKRSG